VGGGGGGTRLTVHAHQRPATSDSSLHYQTADALGGRLAADYAEESGYESRSCRG